MFGKMSSESQKKVNIVEQHAEFTANQDGQLDASPSAERSSGDENGTFDWESSKHNPRNWTPQAKLFLVIRLSILTFCTNLANLIFAPSSQALIHEFNVTNPLVGTLTMSIYVLGACVGPLLMSPLSELYGRLIIYRVSGVLYEASTVGCALSTNVSMFLFFRCVAGCAGGAPMAIFGGTVADLYAVEGRAKAMALFSIGPLIGPVVGPIIGGVLTEYAGWRWSFWLIAILAGVSVLSMVFMRETFAPVLQARHNVRSQEAIELDDLKDEQAPVSVTHGQHLRRALARPFKMLVFSPAVSLISLYCAFVFGLAYLLFTTFPVVFKSQYGWGPTLSGLSYLGLAVGNFVAIGWIGAVSDKGIKQDKAKGIKVEPEARLKPAMWTVLAVPVGFLWYGWAAQDAVHWIVPIMGTALIGFGQFCLFMPSQVYLVDSFGTDAAASAMAVNSCLRSVFGTFVPLAGPPLYEAVGLGWGNSLLAFLGLFFTPVPWLLFKYGGSLRTRYTRYLQ